MIVPMIYCLQEEQQLLVESFTKREVINGPGVYVSKPFQRITRRAGITLGPTEYLRIRNVLNGEIRNEIGPKLYFLQADEEVIATQKAIVLKKNQYTRVIDERNGRVRVERGDAVVYLLPTERVLESVRDGVNIDDETAVVVNDIETGQRKLMTTPQVFIPSPDEKIVEIRKRICLEDHETVVIKDTTGKYIFKTGQGEDRSFFLDPYSELVTFRWSSGLSKDERSLEVTHIDSRPKFMWYEFDVRTQDNVELTLSITFFWQIIDAYAMIRSTDDTPGDICSHSRSAVIQCVSRVTLEDFLADFNNLIKDAVLDPEDGFYKERGVCLQAIEVRSITCQDSATQKILQEIIRETTNRINELQKQESSNEVQLKRIGGEIESERMNQELLQVKQENVQKAAQMDGEAEALRVKAFFEGIGDKVETHEAVAIYKTLRKQDILEKLSEGTAQLYFTPSDVDLSIESHQNGSRTRFS